MKAKKKIEYLIRELFRIKKVNKYSPFPMYDTEDVKDFENKITKMELDNEKVECCKNCKSLFLINDELNNTWCGRCNTPNEIEECETINHYLLKYGNIWI